MQRKEGRWSLFRRTNQQICPAVAVVGSGDRRFADARQRHLNKLPQCAGKSTATRIPLQRRGGSNTEDAVRRRQQTCCGLSRGFQEQCDMRYASSASACRTAAVICDNRKFDVLRAAIVAAAAANAHMFNAVARCSH